MDRKIFKLPIMKSGLTKLPCPTCAKGQLKIKNDTFHYEETKESKRGRSHEAWEPEWIESIYSCLLE
jgi:hypothetical protein